MFFFRLDSKKLNELADAIVAQYGEVKNVYYSPFRVDGREKVYASGKLLNRYNAITKKQLKGKKRSSSEAGNEGIVDAVIDADTVGDG